MLRFVALAATAALSAYGAAQAVVVLEGQRPLAPAIQPAAQVMVASAVGSPASISKASDGHYWAQADVNGRQVRFLVDTGASAVALTAEDARRLGFDPRSLDYSYTVTTANGPARAAAVTLASVSVAGARIADVEALVIESGLDTSLLGMTFLGRLSRFEATRSSLILRP